MNLRLNYSFYKGSKIIITLALVSMLTVSVFSTSSFLKANAFDLSGIGSDNGLPGLDMGNICFASDCTNQNIKDNQNSPIVTKSDNTNIESGEGDLNHDTNPGLGEVPNLVQGCIDKNSPPGEDGAAVLQYEQATLNLENALENGSDPVSQLHNDMIMFGLRPAVSIFELSIQLLTPTLDNDAKEILLEDLGTVLESSGFTPSQAKAIVSCIGTAINYTGPDIKYT